MTDTTCPGDMFLCHSKIQCVKGSEVCDGNYDCHDHSDEADCSKLLTELVTHLDNEYFYNLIFSFYSRSMSMR